MRGVPQAGRHTRLGPREQHQALLLLVWAGFLETPQLAEAVGYPTLRRAQRRLRVLLDHGLTRAELQSGALHLPSLHVPTRKAIERLMEDGRIDPDYRPPRLPRAQKRKHALLVRDVFTAFAAAETRGLLRLDDFRFDSQLTRDEPFRTAGLIPDAIASVRSADGAVATIAVEADTGTETTATLRKKFAKWRAILDVWRPPQLTLLVVVEREGRLRTLLRLMTEARVEETGIGILTSDIRAFAASFASPHDPAVRVDLTERRAQIVEPSDVTTDSRSAPRAFRVLLRR